MLKFLQNIDSGIKSHITATGLFAFAVLVMIFGHFMYFFQPYEILYRIPDRVLAPVFLIAIGYNSAHKMSKFIYLGAVFLLIVEYFTQGQTHATYLFTIVILKFITEPISRMMISSKESLLAFSFIFALLYPPTSAYIEYSTLAIIMAFAGWYLKNYKTLPNPPIHPMLYFVFTYVAYVGSVQFHFHYDPQIISIVAAGCAVVFYLLYSIKTLLLNSIKRPANNIFTKTVRFIGHKSLGIYLAHMFVFYIFYYLLKNNII